MTQEDMTFTAEGTPNPYGQDKAWRKEEATGARDTAESFFVSPAKSAPANTDNADPQHDWKKRFGDQTTHYDQTKVKLGETEAALAAMTAKFDKLNSGEVQSGDQPYQPPEIEPVVEAPPAEPTGDANLDNINSQLSEIQKERSLNRQEKAVSEITKAHADFSTLKDSNEFHTWAGNKSQTIQNAIYKNPYDYVSAIEALDLYKFESAKAAQAKNAEQSEAQVQSEAASLVSTPSSAGSTDGSQKKTWTTSEIARLTKNPNLLSKYIDEINLAQTQGRIVKG